MTDHPRGLAQAIPALAQAIRDTADHALRPGASPWERQIALRQVRDFTDRLIDQLDTQEQPEKET